MRGSHPAHAEPRRPSAGRNGPAADARLDPTDLLSPAERAMWPEIRKAFRRLRRTEDELERSGRGRDGDFGHAAFPDTR